LENAGVRASAISALAKFGVALDSLRPSIIVLLKRCLNDNDVEVRDRATLLLKSLETERDITSKLINTDLEVPLVNLERSLLEYKKNPHITPFDITKVPITPVSTLTDTKKTKKPADNNNNWKDNLKDKEPSSVDMYSSLLSSIPAFASLGQLHKSSKQIELTESETEYVVNCVKHIFQDHIVFQFNCTNTLKDQLLENISVKMEFGNIKDVKLESVVPLQSLPYGTPGSTFVCVSKSRGSYPTGSFVSTLKFNIKEVDPQTGEPDSSGYGDEYQLEDAELSTCDYMQKTFVPSFQEKWDAMGDEFEVQETYSLSTMKSLQDAVKAVVDHLGMQPCERSDTIPPKKSKHILYLSGNFVGGVSALVRARMKFVEGQGVQMQLTVRSTSDDVSTIVASAI